VNAVAGRHIEEQITTGPIIVSVIDQASIPSQKSSPKPVPVMLGAILMGLIAGLFAAVVAARLRQSLDRARTIRQRLGTTVLGEVPSIRGLRSERHDLLPWLASSPPAELVEAFQGIRTNIEFRLADLDARTIVVTSYQASAGKSTVATGLAWSLAAVGRPALLLDADLRRPTLHEKLGTDPGAGLADMINVDPLSLVQPTFVPNLEFVPAGLPAGRPADVVSRALPRALHALDRPDRLIILDSPPVEGVPETGVVVAAGKYVVLVLDAKSVELPELGEAVFRLQDSGAVVLGVVINRVSRRSFRRKTAYYGYQKAPNRAAAKSRRSRQLQGTPMAGLRARRNRPAT
jgi:capsular exopolysaccharide synthesis family protein